MTRHATTILLICVCAGFVSAQQRDRPISAVATGIASIAGQVVSDDAAGRPVARAIVTLGGDVSDGRSAITDDNGRFTFANLPAGRFSISASKAAFLPAAYGARRPGRPGTTLVVADGAQQQVTIRMARGAVLSGIIRDRNGNGVPNVEVEAVNRRAPLRQGGSPFSREVLTTDDRGMFRIYGLLPGDYFVRATMPAGEVGGAGPVGARSAAEIDAVLAALQRRNETFAAGLATPQAAPKVPLARPVGFAPTYFPGTTSPDEATVVTLAAGEERGGVDFQVNAVGAGAIVGTVGSIANPAVVQLSIYPIGAAGPSPGSNPVLSERPSATSNGFRYSNVTPGKYRVLARVDRNQTAPSAAQARLGGEIPITPANADFLYASADIDALGDDITGVSLDFQPGSTLTGRLTFDASSAPVPTDLSGLRVRIGTPAGSYFSLSGGTLIGNSFAAGASGDVQADGTFVIKNVAPGSYLVNIVMPAAISGTWTLLSAVVGERDVLDGMLDVGPGVNLTGARVTLTDRRSEVSGTLQGAAGVPAPDYFVVVFPADKKLWGAARRIKSTRPSNDGRYTVRDLPAGEYLLAALTDVEPVDLSDTGFFEQLVPAALKMTIESGEKKTQDLRLAQ